MGKLASVFNLLRGRKATPPPPTRHGVRARFDASVTNSENSRHWANSDALAADAAVSPDVRYTLRNRGRYEQFNNPFTDGMLQTLAADVAGKGPRLQMLTKSEPVNAWIEEEFTAWSEAVQLGEKLRLMVETRAAAGECFALMTSNPKLATACKLDLRLIEGDQVATPEVLLLSDRQVDGIVFDQYGNPVEYHVLKHHPGSTQFQFPDAKQFDRIPAADMLHLYKVRRPGQWRGIPQITSGLPLFAERRGFRQSVLQAARVCSELGAVMIETDGSAYSTETVEPFEEVEISRGMMMTLPNGSKAKQMEPVQPGTTYKEFDDKLINESARPLNMPKNVAMCDSSSYNYSSGQLDHGTYDGSNEIDRKDIELKVLNRILARWLDEALRIPGYMYAQTRVLMPTRIPHDWLWRRREHGDPEKDAAAAQTRLTSLESTLEDEWLRKGLDPETQWTKLEKQSERLKKLGLTLGQAAPAAAKPEPAQDNPDDKPATTNGVHKNGVNGSARVAHRLEGIA